MFHYAGSIRLIPLMEVCEFTHLWFGWMKETWVINIFTTHLNSIIFFYLRYVPVGPFLLIFQELLDHLLFLCSCSRNLHCHCAKSLPLHGCWRWCPCIQCCCCPYLRLSWYKLCLAYCHSLCVGCQVPSHQRGESSFMLVSTCTLCIMLALFLMSAIPGWWCDRITPLCPRPIGHTYALGP